MERRLPLFLALLCAAAALRTGAAAAADVEPCKVLTESDVRRVLGAEWKFVESVSGDAVCGYMGATNAFTTITLYYSEDGAAPILEMRRKMAGERATPLPGPGGGAFRFATPMANVIVFGRGDWTAQLDLTLAASPDTGLLDRLAKRAYDRLPEE
jgi:hypothetical protein